MAFPRLAIIAVDTNKDLNILKSIHRLNFMVDTEIHFVHIVRKMDYNDALSLNANFPLFQDMDAIKDAVVEKMKSITPEIIPHQHIGKIIYTCLFGFDPKKDFCNYLNELKPELVLVVTRPKHGLFESSFSHYVCRHSEFNVLVLKS